MSTEQAHLESYERDLANDFKDIDKRYTAQLVQVKVRAPSFIRMRLVADFQIRSPTWRIAIWRSMPKLLISKFAIEHEKTAFPSYTRRSIAPL